MGARFRLWWQQIKRHPFIATVIIVVLFALIAFIFAAYRFGWSGTGFLNKTLWDWLQLLIIPLALAVVALVFQLANTKTERQIAKERYEQDQQIAQQRYEQDQQLALDKQHEDLLQAYLDRIAELLLKENLRTSSDGEVRNVAQVRTITVLTQLDARRIGYVFAFLRDAGLMLTTSDSNVVNLKDANLAAVKWRGAFLRRANLSGAILNTANLSYAFLRSANLSGAFLNHANLNQAILTGADLKGAQLNHSELSGAKLSDANLSRAILNHATLSDATLSDANLEGATLVSADLSEAKLIGAKVTTEQLDKAKSLKGATMPDGSIHP